MAINSRIAPCLWFDTQAEEAARFYVPEHAHAGARGMRQLLESKRALLGIQLPGEFLFLLRIRFGLMSVLARIGARANWYELERQFLA